MASAKIHINLSLGLVEAEGDEAFVSKVYADFKDRITSKGGGGEGVDDGVPAGGGTSKSGGKVKKKAFAKKNSSEGDSPGISKLKPTLVKSLDLSKLKTFMALYDPQSAAERTLLFVSFLKDELGIEPCTADHIFSCYVSLKEKVPVAFGQHLIDTRGSKKGYIDWTTPNDITITTIGMNFINHEMKKKKDAE